MFSALEKYGTFHPRLLLSPVIQRAKDGWLLDEWSHSQIEGKKANLKQFPSSAKLYLNEDGDAVPVGMCNFIHSLTLLGSVIVNKDYANMLKTILTDGWRSFYNGNTVFSRSN